MFKEEIHAQMIDSKFNLVFRDKNNSDELHFALETNWIEKTGEATGRSITQLPGDVWETAHFSIGWTTSETRYAYQFKKESPQTTSERSGDEPDIFRPELHKIVGRLSFIYYFRYPEPYGRIRFLYDGIAGEKTAIDIVRDENHVDFYVSSPKKNCSIRNFLLGSS